MNEFRESLPSSPGVIDTIDKVPSNAENLW